MNLFSLTRSTAAAAMVACSVIPAAAREAENAPKNLEFTITKGTMAEGKVEYTGTVSFNRESVQDAFKVTWKLNDGSTYTGYGVASGDYMAVAYGAEATGVAIYKVKEKTIDGVWAPAADGAKTGTYGLKRGKVKYQYVYDDGTPGTISIKPTEVVNVANVSYEMPDKKFGGVGIMDGDYMAVGAASGIKSFGVVIYRMNKDLTASGKWIVPGGKAPGTEELKLVSLNGQSLAGAAGGEAEKKAAPEMDNKKLAELIQVDLQKCAAVGEYFLEQMKLDDMEAVVGLMDDKAFDEKNTRAAFSETIAKGRKELGKLTGFTPDKTKTDFKAAPGGGMLFSLEGDGAYENGKTREVLTFLKPQGSDKVVLVGYRRTVSK